MSNLKFFYQIKDFFIKFKIQNSKFKIGKFLSKKSFCPFNFPKKFLSGINFGQGTLCNQNARSCSFTDAIWINFETKAFGGFSCGIISLNKKWKSFIFSFENCQRVMSEKKYLAQVSGFSFPGMTMSNIFSDFSAAYNFFAWPDDFVSTVEKIQEGGGGAKSLISSLKVLRCGVQLIDWSRQYTFFPWRWRVRGNSLSHNTNFEKWKRNLLEEHF